MNLVDPNKFGQKIKKKVYIEFSTKRFFHQVWMDSSIEKGNFTTSHSLFWKFFGKTSEWISNETDHAKVIVHKLFIDNIELNIVKRYSLRFSRGEVFCGRFENNTENFFESPISDFWNCFFRDEMNRVSEKYEDTKHI